MGKIATIFEKYKQSLDGIDLKLLMDYRCHVSTMQKPNKNMVARRVIDLSFKVPYTLLIIIVFLKSPN